MTTAKGTFKGDWVMNVELQVPNELILDFAEPDPVQAFHVREYLKRRLNELIEEGGISHFHCLSEARQVWF